MNRHGAALAFLLLFCALGVAACGDGPPLEGLRPEIMSLEESFREPARTRLPRDWIVAMPVDGRIGPVLLRSGDGVTEGQELASFDRVPLETRLREARAAVGELEASLKVHRDDRLERTALADAEAAVDAAREALKASDAEIEAEAKRAAHAATELARKEELFARKAVSKTDLDRARLDGDTSLIELRRQEFYRASLQALIVGIELGPRFVRQYLSRKELEREELVQRLHQARARLERTEHELSKARLVSPVTGVVLERLSQGDRPLVAGTPLLRIGRRPDLEAVAEVLTEDALRLPPDAVVEMRSGPGLPLLRGRVDRVEASAFTKLSSLGVEQQRVRVICRFESALPEKLGEGYRLQARFVTARREKVRALPRQAVLQEADGRHVVFVVADGRLRRRTVRIGIASERHMEIVDGLAEGEGVVARPDTTMLDGNRARLVFETERGGTP